MSAYWPADSDTLWLVLALLIGTLATGLGISRLRPTLFTQCAAWLLMLAATTVLERLTAHEPAGFRMLAICTVLLFGMKAPVSVAAQAAGGPRLSPLRWLGFAALWPGMRPALFVSAGGPALTGIGSLVGRGLQWLAAGLALILLARAIWTLSGDWLDEEAARILATMVLLPGLSLVIHFGIFNVVAGLWRQAGVDCRPLFRAPLRARTLTEFWGRRWNLAFTEMTAISIYRPLVGQLGRSGATFTAFLFSGLAHELAISVPVDAGYGLPTLYFALHGTLVLLEQELERRGLAISPLGPLAHVWTLGWLGLLLPVLFHPWFLEGVVWPIIGMGLG